MTTTAPILSSREVNIAAIATRALLTRLLDRSGTPFESWLTLQQVGDADAAGTEVHVDDVVARFVRDLQLAEPAARAAVATAVEIGLLLVVDGDRLTATERGRSLYDDLTARVRESVARVYAGIDSDDLVVARRVIDAITAGARAELAAI
jgi:hypothetical protein